MKILIADVDQFWSGILKDGFFNEGFSVDLSSNGNEALEMAKRVDYDVILMDVLLPGLDGFTVIREIRAGGSEAAIIMVSREGRDLDELEGFKCGIDDYMVKPIALPKLIARIHAIQRRKGKSADKGVDPFLLRAGPLELHVLKREVKVGGKRVHMTRTEFDLLERFMRQPGRVLCRSVLVRELISGDISASSNSIETHVKNVRIKIDGGSKKSLIRTIRGVGYALDLRDVWASKQ